MRYTSARPCTELPKYSLHQIRTFIKLLLHYSAPMQTSSKPPRTARVSEMRALLLKDDDPFSDIIGQDNVKKGLKSALLAGRNILIVGPVGVGKTTLAKNVARLLGTAAKENKAAGESSAGSKDNRSSKDDEGRKGHRNSKGDADSNSHLDSKRRADSTPFFVRVQGSPDLTVEDLLGDIDPIKALKFGPMSEEAFSKGKIFKADKGVLFFDELNRCPEKLQNALLQVLEEHAATISSYDVDFDADFIFIATMNPHDASTEKLSDVLLDRFDVMYMGYPETKEIEKRIVALKGEKIEDVEFPEPLLDLTVFFVRLLRESSKLEKVPSVRATLGLYQRAQANAIIARRKTVEFRDIAEAAVSVLAHRITLKPSVKYLQSPEELLKEELSAFMEKHKLAEFRKEAGEG